LLDQTRGYIDRGDRRFMKAWEFGNSKSSLTKKTELETPMDEYDSETAETKLFFIKCVVGGVRHEPLD